MGPVFGTMKATTVRNTDVVEVDLFTALFQRPQPSGRVKSELTKVDLSVGLLVISISLYAFTLMQISNHMTTKCVRFHNNNV